MKNIKELMLEAIRQPIPDEIRPYCRDIWNQPFFYQIDKATTLTIGHAPTDAGARNNYSDVLARYQNDHSSVSAEEIYDILYNFKFERKWRNKYNRILEGIGLDIEKVAHMDLSMFAYDKDEYAPSYGKAKSKGNIVQAHDISKKYLREAIELLLPQLSCIFVNGKHNEFWIEEWFGDQVECVNRTRIPLNANGKTDVLIYRHKKYNVKILYLKPMLHGGSRVSNLCLDSAVDFYKKNW